MADPLQDLDDLLNQLDKTSKRAAAPPPKAAAAPPPPVAAPASAASSSSDTNQWKNELDGLLNELSMGEPATKNTPKQTTKPQSSTPAQQLSSPATVVQPPTARVIQSGPPPSFTSSDFENVSFLQGGGSVSLSPDEQALVRELNKARTNPAAYADVLERERRPYFDGKNLKLPGSNVILVTEEGQFAVDDAINFLRNEKPLPPFSVSVGMTKAAKEAIAEIGPKGDTSCESIQKFEKYGRFEQEAVEIASFGTSDAKEIVVRFLVCDGSPDRVQRTYIFEPIYKAIGVAVGAHNSAYKTMACLNFTKMFHAKEP